MKIKLDENTLEKLLALIEKAKNQPTTYARGTRQSNVTVIKVK